MKRLKMDPIETSNPTRTGTRLLIPGGWHALVPKVEPDMHTYAAYTSYFAQTVSPLEARRMAQECVQGVFDGGYLHLMRMAMARRVRRYAKLFPSLLEPAKAPKRQRRSYFQAIGFQPEELQSSFIPGGNSAWEDKMTIEQMLREMGRAALDANHRTLAHAHQGEG